VALVVKKIDFCFVVAGIAQFIENIIIHDYVYTKMSEKSLEYDQQHDINKALKSFERPCQEQADKF